MLDKDSVGKLHSHLSVATAIMLTNERIHFKEEGRGEREREREIRNKKPLVSIVKLG